MIGLKILFSVMAWLIWWGGLVLVIQMDRRQLEQKARAEGSENPNQTRLAPYVVCGLLCGGFVLPIYFWVTRRTLSATLAGFGLALLLSLAAGFVSFVGTLAAGVP